MRPANRAATTALVVRYLDGVARETVGSIADRLPTDPEDPYDYTSTSMAEEEGSLPPLVSEQTAAAMAALHAVLCSSVEGAIPTSTDPPQLPEGACPADIARQTCEWRLALRWLVTLDRVRKLGDYAVPWFTVQLRRFEGLLPEQVSPWSTQPHAARQTEAADDRQDDRTVPDSAASPHRTPPGAPEPPTPAEGIARAPDGPFDENGQFGIRWNGFQRPCDDCERQPWAIIRAMWPPADRKERPVSEVKRRVGTTAEHEKWATNEAVKVRKILDRVKMGFTFVRAVNPDGAEVFRWERVSH
jgi:hypothetical protein